MRGSLGRVEEVQKKQGLDEDDGSIETATGR
jgi:hypothetical protein